MEVKDGHIEIRAIRNLESDKEFLRTIPAGFRISFKDKEKLWDIANHYLHESQEYLKIAKRGEKYEAMWEEDAKEWLGNDLDLEMWMNDTKQKYFPKEK